MGEASVFAVEQREAVSDRPSRTVRALCEHPLLDVTWSRYEAGERGPDLHVHHEHVDAFYVVEGELAFVVGPGLEPVRAPAGTFVAVPPNIAHTFNNDSKATARWLNFHAPSTGFLASLRGLQDGFDSFDPPASGGLPRAGATVTAAGHDGELGREPQIEAMELTVDSDFDVAPHHHDGQVNVFFVLEGDVEFTVGGGYLPAGRGTFMSVPPGALHGLRRAGVEPAKVLFVRAPPPT
jgi:mannose-6-phosphate isomerase-like protein (cupin superfamily)